MCVCIFTFSSIPKHFVVYWCCPSLLLLIHYFSVLNLWVYFVVYTLRCYFYFYFIFSFSFSVSHFLLRFTVAFFPLGFYTLVAFQHTNTLTHTHTHIRNKNELNENVWCHAEKRMSFGGHHEKSLSKINCQSKLVWMEPVNCHSYPVKIILWVRNDASEWFNYFRRFVFISNFSCFSLSLSHFVLILFWISQSLMLFCKPKITLMIRQFS